MIISTNNPLYIKSVEVSETNYGYFVDIWTVEHWTTTDFYIDGDALNVVFNPYKNRVLIHDPIFETQAMSLFTDEIANHYMVACISCSTAGQPFDKKRLGFWQNFI